jgi:ATP-dependent Clp protease ATP-binding subunit ClpC
MFKMVDQYSEKARRAIFFARYEATRCTSPYVETEHLLLGLLREDEAQTNPLLCAHASVESIRKQIEKHTTIVEKVSTSVDLPLSDECKRVVAHAGEEAERLSRRFIGTEHLLLGLLREENCLGAQLLKPFRYLARDYPCPFAAVRSDSYNCTPEGKTHG